MVLYNQGWMNIKYTKLGADMCFYYLRGSKGCDYCKNEIIRLGSWKNTSFNDINICIAYYASVILLRMTRRPLSTKVVARL